MFEVAEDGEGVKVLHATSTNDSIDEAMEVASLREQNSTLEERVRELERNLRLEKDSNKRKQAELSIEHERETNEAERHWMEQISNLRKERDRLQAEVLICEDQMEKLSSNLSHMQVKLMESHESMIQYKRQFETMCGDYDETMQERSSVLEENARLTEERDKLRQSVKQLSATLHARQNEESEQLRNLTMQLEATKRMLYHNNDPAKLENRELRKKLQAVSSEHDEVVRALSEKGGYIGDDTAVIVDQWSTHSFTLSLHSKGNLGVVLDGGSIENGRRNLPIYVRDVLTGSPFEPHLRRLDHIIVVNDIDVAEMDVRSVIDILRNSHNLKMIVRRRTSLHRVVQLSLKSDLGMELATGIFVNRLEKGGPADRAGIKLGNRLIYVNGNPVFDASHANEIISKDAHQGTATLCFLNGAQRNPSVVGLNGSTSKHRTLFSKVHDKLFRRNGASSPSSNTSNSERSHVVARANIDDQRSGGDYFIRHGSLRLPSHSTSTHQFVRAGSLRAPQGSADHKQIIESLDRYLQGHISKTSPLTTTSVDNGSTWPKSREVIEGNGEAIMRRRGPQRPSLFPVFAAPPPPPLENASDRQCSCASPSQWNRQYNPSPIPSSISNQRVSTYSPSLPQPPPYPGPRFDDQSMSSIMSSSNSVPLSTTSTLNRHDRHPPNNSPSESEKEVRRVCISKEQSDYAPGFGVGLENGSEGGVYVAHVHERAAGVHKGDRVLDIGGINMRSADKTSASRVLSQFHASQDEVTLTVSARGSNPSAPFWVSVPRDQLVLCGGNAVGILIETNVGDLLAGDCILELDGYDLRKSTLEEAQSVLHDGHSHMIDILAQRGCSGMDKLRSGGDGDGFYVRVNSDRIGETNDELDVKQGEIVYVDNTMFMGQQGRWRAWKIDSEGRQRQCGIIPSATVVEASAIRINKHKNASSRPQSTICRPVYERVERISTLQPRPVLLFGAIIAPFIQALLDEHSNKFSPCVPECRALSQSELDHLFASGSIVDARRRDKLYDVISIAAVQHVIDRGVHVILDVAPSALNQLHALRIYPIVIRIKFKSPKQIKELKEELGEKMTSKQAKELFDRSLLVDNQLENAEYSLATVPVGVQTPVKSLVRHLCQQIIAHVDHEQKKSVWVTMV